MGKYSTDSSDIIEYIVQDYVEAIKGEEKSSSIIDKIPFLITNNYACKITESAYTDVTIPFSSFHVVCKFMYEHNKTLKDHRRKLLPYEFGGSETRYAKTDPRLLEITKYSLEDGEYYAQISKNVYAVLLVSTDEEDSCYITWTLYLIGKKWKKWKERLYKDIDEFSEIRKWEKTEQIAYSDGRSPQTTIFKPFDQVVFPGKEEVLAYIDNWVNNIPVYYKEYKMVSKLSILLYGDPGTGKSTFSKAVANYLDIPLVTSLGPDYFSSHNEENGGWGSRRRVSTVSRIGGTKTVYTIDDIDCVCHSREVKDDKDNNAAMSNLLQFLDNPPTFFYKAKDGVHYPVSIVIATTNYMDKLDSAVKRYGRFDMKLEMRNFDKETAQKMCDLYHLRIEDLDPNCDNEGWTISPSYLQAVCLENIDKSLKEVR